MEAPVCLKWVLGIILLLTCVESYGADHKDHLDPSNDGDEYNKPSLSALDRKKRSVELPVEIFEAEKTHNSNPLNHKIFKRSLRYANYNVGSGKYASRQQIGKRSHRKRRRHNGRKRKEIINKKRFQHELTHWSSPLTPPHKIGVRQSVNDNNQDLTNTLPAKNQDKGYKHALSHWSSMLTPVTPNRFKYWQKITKVRKQ